MIFSFPSDSLDQYLSNLRAQHKKIVFTNGCFDLMHWGHISYLQQAKSKGDLLIVGLNSDPSITAIKGPSRPIQDILSRSHVLEELKSVDAVVIFEEETPLELIKAVMPEVLVKGADYSVDQIVGASDVLQNGGTVETIALEEGYSTSQIVTKIKNDL